MAIITRDGRGVVVCRLLTAAAAAERDHPSYQIVFNIHTEHRLRREVEEEEVVEENGYGGYTQGLSGNQKWQLSSTNTHSLRAAQGRGASH